MAAAQIVAINSDADVCACCGKSGLKRVVWIRFDGGEPTHYGTSCAAASLGMTGSYTAKTADKLRADHAAKLQRAAAWSSCQKSAQVEANQAGGVVYAIREKGICYTLRAAVAESRMIYGEAKPFCPAAR